MNQYRQVLTNANKTQHLSKHRAYNQSRQNTHPQLEKLLQEKKQSIRVAQIAAQNQLPKSEFECALLLLNDEFPSLPEDVNFDERSYMQNQVYIDYAKKEGIDEEQARAWLKHPASRDINISRDEFLKSGSSNLNEFLQMKKEGFSNAKMYQNYILIYQEIIGTPLNKPVSNSYAAKQKILARQQRHGKVAFDARRETPDERKIKSYVRHGWDKSWDIKNAMALGIKPADEKSYYEMKDKIKSWGLDGTKLSHYEWLKENGTENTRYKGFDAPRHAALYHIIDRSNSNRFLIDSLVEQYNALDEPGIDLNKSELCSLLTSPPFDSWSLQH